MWEGGYNKLHLSDRCSGIVCTPKQNNKIKYISYAVLLRVYA